MDRLSNDTRIARYGDQDYTQEAPTGDWGAEVRSARDWRRAMSDHVAYALLVYTGLQIFLTVKAMDDGLPSILPYLALVLLVAAIIPACRWFEKRWTGMSDEQASDEKFAPAFRRDTIALWLVAILLPLVLTGLFKAAFAFA